VTKAKPKRKPKQRFFKPQRLLKVRLILDVDYTTRDPDIEAFDLSEGLEERIHTMISREGLTDYPNTTIKAYTVSAMERFPPVKRKPCR